MISDLERLRARAAIEEALLRYCRGVDRGDAELVRSAFHEDSYDHHGGWRGTGWDFADFITTDIRLRTTRTTHALANVLVEPHPDDPAAASVESYVFAYLWRQGEGDEVLDVFAGRYIDRFERRAGEWRISSRTVVHDCTTRPATTTAALGLALDSFAQGDRSNADPSYDPAGHGPFKTEEPRA